MQGGFLSSAMHCIGDLVRKRPDLQRLTIVVMASDLGLLSNGLPHALESGIEAFLRSASFLKHLKHSQIHFICSIVSVLPFQAQIDRNCSQGMMAVRRGLDPFGKHLTFHAIPNTGIYYEEELRLILEGLAEPVASILHLPMVGRSKLAGLELNLKAFTMSAQEGMHEGLTKPTLYSVASKSVVNVLHICGQGLIVTPSPNIANPQQKASNDAAFLALSSVLSTQNAMLILKVPYQQTGSQYWALIPYNETQCLKMALALLVSREDVIGSTDEVKADVQHDESLAEVDFGNLLSVLFNSCSAHRTTRTISLTLY